MREPAIGELRLELLHVEDRAGVERAVQLDRQRGGDRRAVVAAARERLRAAEHREPAAAFDVAADVLEVVADAVRQVLEVLQDDEVERRQLLLEQLARRERDQRHLVVGYERYVVLRAQDEEAD